MFKTHRRFLQKAGHGETQTPVKREPPRPRRVLVVDDEEPIRNFVGRALTGLGYHTALAADGTEALQVAAQLGPFDFLVTDVVMPQMSGDDLAQRMLRDQPQVKVLYLTGHSHRLFTHRVMLGDHEAFLDKPFSIDGLREALALITPTSSETGGGRFLA